MHTTLSRPIRAILFISAAVLAHACYSMQGSGIDTSRKTMPSIRTIAVAGFSAGVRDGEGSGRVRSSLTGYVFDAEPVPGDISERMSELLFGRITSLEGLTFFSPGQTAAAAAGLIRTQKGLTMDQPELYKEIGRLLGADAVLVGFIYRWREREGKEFGVSSAASVAFDLQLLLTEDATVVWRGKFDKTQRSLSEDLFDFSTFLKAGGKWVSAEQLALAGLDALVERLKSDLTGKPEGLPEAQEERL